MMSGRRRVAIVAGGVLSVTCALATYVSVPAFAASGEKLSGTPCTTSARVCIDLDDQTGWIAENGKVIRGPVNISSGGAGKQTPLGTFRVTLEEARVGERVGTLRHTDIFGGICDDVLTLKEVTAKRIVTTSVGAPGNRDVCNQARHTVLLTPVGDDLVYESDSKDSGRPEARLSRIE